MLEIKNVAFEGENEKFIRSIRESVFIKEQGIAPEIDFDSLDSIAVHALIFIDSKPVGTGRILEDGHIGRIAVLSDCRGMGLGSKIVQSLIDVAREKGYERVYLGAQKHAVGFYNGLGFSTYGGEFIEAGIVHLSMEKILR